MVMILIGLFLLITVVLTWIIPYGQFQGSTLIESEKYNIGLNDFGTIFSSSISFVLDKIIFLLTLGGFYAILSKTDAYKKITSSIVKKIKGKELIFTIIVSVLMTLLSSVVAHPFVLLIFVPFLLTILLNSGVSKITSFAATFGAIAIGLLSPLYSSEGIIIFDSYFSQSIGGKTGLELTIGHRAIILSLAVILYNFFLYMALKRVANNKKKEAQEIKDEFVLENPKDKKSKTMPLIILSVVLFVFIILGFVNWAQIFRTDIFESFHTWLTGLKIGENYTIVSYILGHSAASFGNWTLFNISTVMVIISLLVALLYRVKFDEYLSSFGTGALKLIKPIGALVAVYTIFITMYMCGIMPKMVNTVMKNEPKINLDYNGAGFAIFNVDVDEDGKPDANLINQDLDKDGKCDLNCDTNKDGYPDTKLDFDANGVSDEEDETIAAQLYGTSVMNLDADGDGEADVNVGDKFSLPKSIMGATLASIFNTDLGYTGYALGLFIVSTTSTNDYALVFIIFVTIFGLLQLFIPTGVMVMFGLTYLDVKYFDWMKYIWRFILGMLCLLLIIFIFVLIV